MNELRNISSDLIDALKTERDQLRVQIHLASAELRDRLEAELDQLDHKWAVLKSKANITSHEAIEVSKAVSHDLENMSDNATEISQAIVKEIKEGYQKIRKTLDA